MTFGGRSRAGGARGRAAARLELLGGEQRERRRHDGPVVKRREVERVVELGRRDVQVGVHAEHGLSSRVVHEKPGSFTLTATRLI